MGYWSVDQREVDLATSPSGQRAPALIGANRNLASVRMTLVWRKSEEIPASDATPVLSHTRQIAYRSLESRSETTTPRTGAHGAEEGTPLGQSGPLETTLPAPPAGWRRTPAEASTRSWS
jgi:hypothetical protein